MVCYGAIFLTCAALMPENLWFTFFHYTYVGNAPVKLKLRVYVLRSVCLRYVADVRNHYQDLRHPFRNHF